ncbi:MAG: serine hydrolase [Clostridia bacterium]|nr:serine hydrolase [Clostridia bacterium]
MNYEKIREEKYRSTLTDRLTGILTRSVCKGISVAICGEASVLLKGAAGIQSQIDNSPLTTDSVFWADQLAAPVVAYAAWKLHEEGILNLDRPLTEYTAEPFLPGERNLDYVTGRSVLSHTSGFPLRKHPTLPTHIELMPTTVFSYSNYALLYLQRAMEQATKTDLQALVNELVFQPFRMNSSSFVWKEEFAEKFAHPHVKGQANQRVRAEKPNASKYFYTTPMDYCLFLNKLFVPQTSRKCLAPLTLEKMLQPQVELFGGLKWTAGMGLFEDKNGRYYWQFGDNEGSKSLALIDPQADLCICAMSNDAHGFDALNAFWKDAFAGASPWEKYRGFSLEKAAFDQKVKAAKKKYS